MREDILKRIKEKVHNLPSDPGVYKMLDMYGNIIYIGKAKNLKNRVSSYFIATKKQPKVEQMVENVYDFEYIVTLSELEALNLESNLIHKHQPFYNILLKDGKAFPYIKIDYKNPYPKVQITRKVLNDGHLYFGPFFNKINVTELYKIIHNSFKLRDCNLKMGSKNNRECLNYHIHNCLAPCTGRCSYEEYRKEVDKVVAFLKGDLSIAKSVLEEKMKTYAEMEMFERAIEIRNNIESIKLIDAENITGLARNTDIDVFGYADNGVYAVISVVCVRGNKVIGVNNYNVFDASIVFSDTITNFITQYYITNKLVPHNIVVGESGDSLQSWLNDFAGKKINMFEGKRGIYRRLLEMADKNASEYLNKSIEKNKMYELKTKGAMENLQKILGLSKLPKRIEGYDISNLAGTNTVASMVVFTNGTPDKKMYRKFKIESTGQNDFKNMHDILERRLREYSKGDDISFSNLPDLILIDGGIIQLTFARESMESLGFKIDMISLAERNEEIYKIDGSKVVLSRDNLALKLLQNVRDESHRFAITFQKSLRQKNTLKSELEKIELLGKRKINNLYEHFKSIDKIKNATIEELMAVDGIGKNIAEKIFNYFNK
jgi:excinuclease ABC subunit C